ncbi:uncharacterized protein LOC8079703 isoform X2 [Sorghum bicolor]|uniref:Uncharacterized protein n=1 Tax=Sorghum bicolor TaxID=4558 RepID=A0A1Z5S4F8_SORBI|nr:uncharacterized protein LOC8079703 isoform X2 [Sorghum bicolor]OQU90699.1 hypothetical protein SORBI_3001G029800 [Sorghum bicolor]|eukprot:XP_021314355.1 uncharacterized protein LOC8079703 isoform X2 [Sorghum bicolor]
MDFDSLPRRELQALCKSNGIRANMSNAAMAEALRCLPSVDRTDEIGRTVPPPPPPPMSAMKEVTNMEEQTHGSLLPRGGRARAKTRMVAAGNTEEDVADQASLTLQGCQRTVARKAAVPPETAEVIREEQEHGRPRGGRARGKTRKAGARKTEEEKDVVPAPNTLPGNKRTVAEEAAAASVDAEEVAVGMRMRRSARSKVKIVLDQKEEDVQAAVRKEHKGAIASAVVSDKRCGYSEEHAVVIAVEEEVAKTQEGQNMTKRAAPYKTHEDLQQDQRMVKEVAAAKKRTRRSTKSKVAAAARKGQKADSSDTTVGPEVDPKEDEVVPKVEECTKPQEGKNETRKATVYKAREEVQPGQVTIAPEAMAAVPQEGQNVTRRAAPHKTHEDLQQDQRPAEEVAMAKKRTRRSTRSKVTTAARKGQKADSSDTTIGSEVDPNEHEVVPKVEEAAKPQEGENETRKVTVYKAQEEVQPGQVTVAPEAIAAVEAEEVATAKRKRRRPTRSKVRVAACKDQKADSSDAVNEPTVSDDPKEEQVVQVVEEGPTKPNEEREQISNVRPFASLPKLVDSPILGVVSKPNAADASDKVAVADEEAIKEDDFTFTGEADLSKLLVNTLDRFAKPMYVSTDKEEKKGSECWWMLL